MCIRDSSLPNEVLPTTRACSTEQNLSIVTFTWKSLVSCHAGESAIRLLCRTWPTPNNRKTHTNFYYGVTLSLQQPSEQRKLLGSLRSYDGNCKENVTLKYNFGLSWVSCDYSILITLYKIGGVHFRLLGTDGFHVKAKNERFTPASSRCRQNLKYENMKITSSFGRLKHCTKKRTARAARLFFLIQPIKSLICSVVVDVAVVKS